MMTIVTGVKLTCDVCGDHEFHAGPLDTDGKVSCKMYLAIIRNVSDEHPLGKTSHVCPVCADQVAAKRAEASGVDHGSLPLLSNLADKLRLWVEFADAGYESVRLGHTPATAPSQLVLNSKILMSRVKAVLDRIGGAQPPTTDPTPPEPRAGTEAAYVPPVTVSVPREALAELREAAKAAFEDLRKWMRHGQQCPHISNDGLSETDALAARLARALNALPPRS